MKKNRWALRTVVLLAISLVLSVTVSAAAEAGSSGDPLVTLSYLNDTYLTTVLSKVDSKISARNTQLTAKIDQQIASAGGGTGASASSTFTVVSLSSGQVLTGGIGCEVMLRVGTAVCTASSVPGLVDETSAGTINSGTALTKNHLYMMTIDNRGVKATAATVKVLVRGTYSIA